MRLSVRGPDDDSLVWLVFDGDELAGAINLGPPDNTQAARALKIATDQAALKRAFGHLIAQRLSRNRKVLRGRALRSQLEQIPAARMNESDESVSSQDAAET